MATLKGKLGPITKVKAPVGVAKLKGVSSGKSGGSKKIASKSTTPKKIATLEVGVAAKAPMAKGTKKIKGFRSPFNQK